MHLTCPNQHGRTPASSTVKADTSILKALTVRVKECGTNDVTSLHVDTLCLYAEFRRLG